MGLVFGLDKGQCSPEDLSQAKNLVPRALQPYITCELKNFVKLDLLFFLLMYNKLVVKDLELSEKFGKNHFFP